jgi:hypothetical protein
VMMGMGKGRYGILADGATLAGEVTNSGLARWLAVAATAGG